MIVQEPLVGPTNIAVLAYRPTNIAVLAYRPTIIAVLACRPTNIAVLAYQWGVLVPAHPTHSKTKNWKTQEDTVGTIAYK